MPLNRSIKILVIFLFFLSLSLCIFLFFYKNILSRKPDSINVINFAESNTIAVVCPEEARNNVNYKDASCKSTPYFGVSGIQQAINDGGKDHTVYIKNGIYKNPSINIISQNRFLRLLGESRDGTILYKDSNINGDTQTSLLINGDGGITIEEMTLSGSRSADLGFDTVGISSENSAALTIKAVNFINFTIGLRVDGSSQRAKIYNSVFYKNDLGIYTTEYPQNLPVTIKNNIFAYNTDSAVNLGNSVSGSNKIITNNTFYKNQNSIIVFITEGIQIINNIFYKNIFSDIRKLEDRSGLIYNTEGIKYNYSTNTINNFCILESYSTNGTPIYKSCYGLLRGPSNFWGISNIRFINENVSSGINLRLISTSPFKNMGDPTILDLDKTRSDVGAYGGTPDYCDSSYIGTCTLNYDFPAVSSTPTASPIASPSIFPTANVAKYDLNGDATVNLLDALFLLKIIFQ